MNSFLRAYINKLNYKRFMAVVITVVWLIGCWYAYKYSEEKKRANNAEEAVRNALPTMVKADKSMHLIMRAIVKMEKTVDKIEGHAWSLRNHDINVYLQKMEKYMRVMSDPKKIEKYMRNQSERASRQIAKEKEPVIIDESMSPGERGE